MPQRRSRMLLEARGASYAPYTDNPDLPPSVVFPNHGFQVLSTTLHLLGVSAVSWVFARRSVSDNLLSLAGWRALSWPSLCTTLVFVVSWAFNFCAAVLVTGTGLSISHTTCTIGILSCTVLYALTKLLIYAYLIEKVWLVWSPKDPGLKGKPSRWHGRLYRGCLLSLAPFCAVLYLMISGRIAEIRSDGACVIGMKGYASLSLLIYDLILTQCLTFAFVWGVSRGGHIGSTRQRNIASRTVSASVAALITSTVNLTVLTSMHGKELGWVFFASCGADVTINAMIIAWVSKQPRARCQNPQHIRCWGIPDPHSIDFLWGAAYDQTTTSRQLDPDGPTKPSVDMARSSSSKPEV